MRKIIDFFVSTMLISDLKNWKNWTFEEKRNFIAFICGFAGLILAIVALPIFNEKDAKTEEEKRVHFVQQIETQFGTFCIDNSTKFLKLNKALDYIIGYYGDFNDTKSYFNMVKRSKIYLKEAYQEIKKESDNGSHDGLYLDGLYHETGINDSGVNIEKAIELYQKSNVPCAKLSLANIYEKKGLSKEAFLILKQISSDLFPMAITQYALFLKKHPQYNTKKEDTKELLKKAANLNEKYALYELGLMSLEEKPQQLFKAKHYFELCSKMGNPDCSTALGDLYAYEKDSQATKGYYETGMKQGSIKAMKKYAKTLLQFKENTLDVQKGQALLKLSGELGDYEAKYSYANLLSFRYFTDDFSPVDILIGKLYCQTWLGGNSDSETILKEFIAIPIETYCVINRNLYNGIMIGKIKQTYKPIDYNEYPFSPVIGAYYEDIDILRINDYLKEMESL